MERLTISEDFLMAILEASASTAFNHRGQPGEVYALGNLEATTNIINVMCTVSEDDHSDLSKRAFYLASSAMDRLHELSKTDERARDVIRRMV